MMPNGGADAPLNPVILMFFFFFFFAQDAEIIRTRDPALLAECDIVVDVGGEFDPKKHRYDHHQRYDQRHSHSICLFCAYLVIVIYISK